MKKILLTISTAVLTTLSVNAQVDYGFETWADTPNGASGVQDPKGWASFNVMTNPLIGMGQTVFKETGSVGGGAAAAKIVTKPIPATISVPGYDTVGLLAIGSINILTQDIKLGTPYTGRPEKVAFYTKYQPASLDTASVTVLLTKYNTTTKQQDIVASGMWTTSATTSAWTKQELTLTYASTTVSPDTLQIMCSSSSFFRPKVNSTFYIDDFGFSGWVGISDLQAIKNNVTAYPTPAKTNINFTSSVAASTVEIVDVAGRIVGVFPMVGNKATVETEKYESGMYIYNVLNDQKAVVGRGKFEVVK
jgi:hypothetical protein